MSPQIQQWLDGQQAIGRDIVLIIDRQAEPDPIVRLFGAGLMIDYVNLYLNTEYSDLADIGPWLVRLSDTSEPVIQELLSAPDQNWGWLGSVGDPGLSALAKHWQDRLLIKEASGPSLFRFQDNRVIARCLASLNDRDRPCLLGPLASALYWDGQIWCVADNPSPGHFRAPDPAPWLFAPEPEHVAREILRTNLLQWTLQFHSNAAARIAEAQSLIGWLDEHIALTERWQWQQPDQLTFLVAYRLHHLVDEISDWAPLPEESPSNHFARCRSRITSKDNQA